MALHAEQIAPDLLEAGDVPLDSLLVASMGLLDDVPDNRPNSVLHTAILTLWTAELAHPRAGVSSF